MGVEGEIGAMSGPTPEKIKAVFVALVNNGLDFIERSADELGSEQKFAIVHFATGLELLLKARLYSEHWTLIAAKPHEAHWSEVTSGSVPTIRASALCTAVSKATGTSLDLQKKVFEGIFNHRNRVLHLSPPENTAKTAAEQLRAWFHLHRLLTQTWNSEFSSFGERISAVEAGLRKLKDYLATRYENLKKELEPIDSDGRLLSCPVCEFRSAEAGPADVEARRIRPFECHVCGYTHFAAQFGDGRHWALESLAASPSSEVPTRDELLDLLDPQSPCVLEAAHTDYPDRGACGECRDLDVTVARDGESYVCVSCGARFEPEFAASCGHCGERWFGRHLVGSDHTGCGHCQGQSLID